MAEEIANYIEDDWNDNALNSRSNAERGYYYNYHTGGTGDLLKGVYRPRWIIANGSPSASGGTLNLPAGDSTQQAVQTPSELSVGKWQYDFQFQERTQSANRGLRLVLINPSASAVYSVQIQTDGDFELHVDDGGQTILISGSWGADTSLYTIELTRDSYSNWELFRDSTSQGTATNSNNTSFTQVDIYNNTKDSIEVDDFIVQ